MYCECDEQAFGNRTISALDALRDPLRIHSQAPGREPIHYALAVRSFDCLSDGSNQVVCFIEVGSCSLQEEQML